MAFKRSAVRSRLSPPKSTDSTLNRCFFLTFFVFLFCWVNEKVNRISRFCPLCRRKAVKMAYIQEKVKGKKIVSFKFKACVGRDDNGKQIFKCTTWYPSADLTPAKARKEAQKVAAIWEDEVRQASAVQAVANALQLVAGGPINGKMTVRFP